MKRELKAKLERVRTLITASKAQAAMIGLQSNFAWLTCGGESHVALVKREASGRLLVTEDETYLLANSIEAPRLKTETLGPLRPKIVEFPWHDGKAGAAALKEIVDSKKVVSDIGDWGARDRSEKFIPLRASFLPEEADRYRELGRDAEIAVNAAAHAIEPGQTEFEIANHIAAAAWSLNITPVVLLVAVDERIRRFRHPIPTEKELENHAMLVLSGRRNGQIVALTRIVHFGKPSPNLRKKHRAVCQVDAAFQLSTIPGKTIKSAFDAGIEVYKERRFEKEWNLHHQGGPCGYEGRDFIVSPATKGKIAENQPFAWNPSITGTKSEDTILATPDGPEIITAAQKWPMLKVNHGDKEIRRPDILVVT